MIVMFVTENMARTTATGDNDDDGDHDDKKMSDVNGGTVTSEYRRQRKVIYEVIV